MKISLIFISIFVLFNVFEYHSTKYLLVDVDPGNNIDPPNQIGLPNNLNAPANSKCPGCCADGCFLAMCSNPEICPRLENGLVGGPNGGMFRKKVKTEAQRCAKLNKKPPHKKEKKCKKPKNKDLDCCKEFQDGGAENEPNEEGGQNGGDDDQIQTVGEDNVEENDCTEKPKNVAKCKAKIEKWTTKGNLEQKCNALIAKSEKKKIKKGKKKDKKCVCTCKEATGNTGNDDNTGGGETPENPDNPGGDDDNNGGGDYHNRPYWF